MSPEEQKFLYELVQNPPPGSKIEAAKRYGVDLTLNLRRLSMTPTERALALEAALELMQELQRPGTTPEARMNFARALKVLTDAGVNFVIVGGFAAVARGWVQVSQDLDICYERTRENLTRLGTALTSYHPQLRGAPPDVRFVLDERTLAQGMNFTLQTDLGDIDLIGDLSGVGQFPAVAQDAAIMQLFGGSCRVASLDTLIRSKRAAGRPKDLNALAELEALREIHEPGSDEEKKQ